MIRVTFPDGYEDREDASPARPLPFLGGSIALGKCREYEVVRVERNGKWVKCRVESYPEQIARLTAERDEAVAQRDQAGDVLSDEIRRCQLFQRSTIKAEHERDAEKARADAAEKRLADLRAWADDIVKRSREEAPKHPGKANTTWTILSVLEWVVERIDGKEESK